MRAVASSISPPQIDQLVQGDASGPLRSILAAWTSPAGWQLSGKSRQLAVQGYLQPREGALPPPGLHKLLAGEPRDVHIGDPVLDSVVQRCGH